MTATDPAADPGPDDHTGAIVRLRSATRTYGEGATLVRALDRVDLDIAAGQYIVLLGPSGSGKTTLLNIIGGIDTLTSGTVEVNGSVVEDLDRQQLTEFRRASALAAQVPGRRRLDRLDLASKVRERAL